MQACSTFKIVRFETSKLMETTQSMGQTRTGRRIQEANTHRKMCLDDAEHLAVHVISNHMCLADHREAIADSGCLFEAVLPSHSTLLQCLKAPIDYGHDTVQLGLACQSKYLLDMGHMRHALQSLSNSSTTWAAPRHG